MFDLTSFDSDRSMRELVFSELDEKMQTSFAAVCMPKCGVDLLRFLDSHVNSFRGTDDIAFHLNESIVDVECGLRALIELGLACELEIAGLKFFGVTSDPVGRGLVREMCVWQERWQARIKRIEKLILGKPRWVIHRTDD